MTSAHQLHGALRMEVLIRAWMFQSSPCVIPVVGSSNINQLRENLSAAEIKLSPVQLEVLNCNIYKSPKYS